MDKRYKLMGPGVFEPPWSEVQALGAAAWLWMHSPMHRSLPLTTLNALLLPAIKRRQFLIATDNDQPVFYMAWAWFDAQAERHYIERNPVHLPPDDWTRGERLWVLDWIAPFGHTRHMARWVTRDLFASRCWRSLDHRGSQRGLRVRSFHGIAVPAAQARLWFDANPVQASRPT